MTSRGKGPPGGGYPASNPAVGSGKPAPDLKLPIGKSFKRGSAVDERRLGENPTFDVGLGTDLGTAVDWVVVGVLDSDVDAGVFLLLLIMGEDLGDEELWLLLHLFPLTGAGVLLLLLFDDGVLALLPTDPLSSSDSSLV